MEDENGLRPDSFLASIQAWFAAFWALFAGVDGASTRKSGAAGAIRLETLMGKVLGDNLAILIGAPGAVSLSRLSTAELNSLAKSAKGGRILSCIALDAEHSGCHYYFPGTSLSSLAARYARNHGDGGAASAQSEAAAMRMTDGKLSKLFAVNLPETVDGTVALAWVLRVPSAASEAVRDDLAALADDPLSAWKIAAGEVAFYILIPSNYERNFQARVEKSPGFADWLRQEICGLAGTLKPENDAEAIAEMETRIAKPTQFAFGQLFLPPTLKIARNRTFRSRFKAIRVSDFGSSAFSDATALWFLVSLDLEGVRIAFFYRVSGDGADRDGFGGEAGFWPIGSILDYCVDSLRRKKPGLRVGGAWRSCAQPTLPPETPIAALIAEATLDGRAAKWEVLLSSAVLNKLSELFFAPWALDAYRATARNLLLSVIALNQELFRRSLETEDAEKGGYAGEDGYSIAVGAWPFFRFADLIGLSDLRLIVQNRLIPRIGLAGILGLLHISYMADTGFGPEPRAVFSRLDFDEAKFLRCLNDTMRGEWKARLENLDFQIFAERDFEAANLLTMNDIYEAAETEKLDLSLRALSLLGRRYSDQARCRRRSDLDLLLKRHVPCGAFERLPSEALRDFLPRIPFRDKVRCFVGESEKIRPLLAQTLSADGRAELLEAARNLEAALVDSDADTALMKDLIEAKIGTAEKLADYLMDQALGRDEQRTMRTATSKLTAESVAMAYCAEWYGRNRFLDAYRANCGLDAALRLRQEVDKRRTLFPSVGERLAAVDAKAAITRIIGGKNAL